MKRRSICFAALLATQITQAAFGADSPVPPPAHLLTNSPLRTLRAGEESLVPEVRIRYDLTVVPPRRYTGVFVSTQGLSVPFSGRLLRRGTSAEVMRSSKGHTEAAEFINGEAMRKYQERWNRRSDSGLVPAPALYPSRVQLLQDAR